MTFMAQREFYFAKGFSWAEGNLYCDRNFMICCNLLCAGKDYFLEKIICSKDYRLKEQTWLAIYAERRPAERGANPPPSFRHKTQFLKGRLSPAFSFTPRTIYHRAMAGKTKTGKITACLAVIEIASI